MEDYIKRRGISHCGKKASSLQRGYVTAARELRHRKEDTSLQRGYVIANEVKQSPKQRLLAQGTDCFVAGSSQ